MSANPPYSAIARIVDYVLQKDSEDWERRELELGPIGNRDHVVNAAWEVQAWLDALLMTPFAQDVIDRLARADDGASPKKPGVSRRDDEQGARALGVF
jgi:hypothetical protein